MQFSINSLVLDSDIRSSMVTEVRREHQMYRVQYVKYLFVHHETKILQVRVLHG